MAGFFLAAFFAFFFGDFFLEAFTFDAFFLGERFLEAFFFADLAAFFFAGFFLAGFLVFLLDFALAFFFAFGFATFFFGFGFATFFFGVDFAFEAVFFFGFEANFLAAAIVAFARAGPNPGTVDSAATVLEAIFATLRNPFAFKASAVDGPMPVISVTCVLIKGLRLTLPMEFESSELLAEFDSKSNPPGRFSRIVTIERSFHGG